ncbi:MAG TPA: GNAT family N-acetyltransferase [Ilumatobacteraceae bacterium]|nr:GNAT family N-acetyltransferase [Ilumatobacteraceae bacterium]
MGELSIVEIAASDTYPLRLEVLRNDTPSQEVAFDVDGLPGTFHLGVSDGSRLVAVSTWTPRPHRDEEAVQLRGMATLPGMQGRGIGAMLLEAGCARAAGVAPLVWARARDTALEFYLRHGFTVDGEGFVDESTRKPHHVIIRRLP